MRRTIAILATLGAALGCSDDPGEPGLDGAPSLSAIADALGCTSVRGTQYDVGLWFDLETEKGRDCYRDSEFFARIHILAEDVRAEDVVQAVQPSGPGSAQPECQRTELSITAGEHWIVVSRGAASAREVRDRTGGRSIDVAGATTFTSYFLPCLDEPEPP
jgi:hypothetical protein